ncbi:RidA family protein [Jongsikchunia kroppenstedtii]|uniref:RidA family protein n=1 Tax=Jongsikchunia kroppenstedtii TaxID=1121721 RepID=UPI0004762948|nr:RidA family protein [Jongsikchunia kroppenstedtii]
MTEDFRRIAYNHNSGWSQSFFTDVVVIDGPHRTIYLSGIGAEDTTAENPEDMRVLAIGDFAEQTRIAYARIKSLLETHGASLADIVRMKTYVLDAENVYLYHQVQREALEGLAPPPHTFLQVAGLASPDMLVEVEVTAVVPLSS